MIVRLIAEFCQNHNGDRENLKEMIFSASRSGFTHGKIQGLYSFELTERSAFESREAAIYRPYDLEVARLKSLDLSESDESWFVEECSKAGITPMITVFSHHGVDRAHKAGFKSIKIASYDCGSAPLIKRASLFAKEIIVSTGATSWENVRKTSEFLSRLQESGVSVALLHARTIYPTPSYETGLARMIALQSLGLPIGFSDHSQPDLDGVLATKFALLLGAEVIERHFTVMAKDQTKDGLVSVNELEASEISNFANLNSKDRVLNLNGDLERFGEFFKLSSLEPTEVESRNASYYRGRVATKIDNKLIFSWEDYP